MNGGWGISCEIALRSMPLDHADDKSTLVQVMAWCRQATNHYLSQCWPRSLSPYGVTRPQWVNTLRPKQNRHLIAVILKVFSWMKIIIFRLKFLWSLSKSVHLIHFWVSIALGYCFLQKAIAWAKKARQHQAITSTWTNVDFSSVRLIWGHIINHRRSEDTK